MSDTPETDAEGYGDGRHPWVATDFARKLERERDEWKNKAYSHATDYTLMEAKCFRLEQELKEIHSNQSVIIKHYDKLKS